MQNLQTERHTIENLAQYPFEAEGDEAQNVCFGDASKVLP
jgi:hypothetical protein